MHAKMYIRRSKGRPVANTLMLFNANAGSTFQQDGECITQPRTRKEPMQALENWNLFLQYRIRRLCHPWGNEVRGGHANKSY